MAVRVPCFALQLSTFISRLQIGITFTLAAGFGFGDLICITNLKSSSLLLLLPSLVSILSRGGRKELSVVGRFPTYHRLDACCIAKQPRSNPIPAFLGLQEHSFWVVNKYHSTCTELLINIILQINRFTIRNSTPRIRRPSQVHQVVRREI